MGKPKPPAPPDPQQTSAAQTGTNLTTALANTIMGNSNQITPYGSYTTQQTGSTSLTDPFTNVVYDIPQFTSTTSLNPQQQQTLDTTQAAQGNIADLTRDQSAFLKDYLAGPFDVNQAVEDKLYDLGSKRLDPRFEREQEALHTRLANQGLTPGSEAYNREMEGFSQGRNDAYNQLALTGRSQALNEAFSQRNQPINEITALLSGSQVTNPTYSPFSAAGMPTTDNAGLINQNFNQRYQNYQQQSQTRNDLLGGMFGLGAGALSGGIFG